MVYRVVPLFLYAQMYLAILGVRQYRGICAHLKFCTVTSIFIVPGELSGEQEPNVYMTPEYFALLHGITKKCKT